jgi:hypothetical protein
MAAKAVTAPGPKFAKAVLKFSARVTLIRSPVRGYGLADALCGRNYQPHYPCNGTCLPSQRLSNWYWVVKLWPNFVRAHQPKAGPQWIVRNALHNHQLAVAFHNAKACFFCPSHHDPPLEWS